MIKGNEMETLTVIWDGIEDKEELRAKNMKVEKQKVKGEKLWEYIKWSRK